MKICCKDEGILINSAILNSSLFAFKNLVNLTESIVQEIHLEMKCPAGHVGIKVAQVRIFINGFVEWSPTIMFGKFFDKSCFTHTDVSGDSDVFDGGHDCEVTTKLNR